jgi:hypothetical protein
LKAYLTSFIVSISSLMLAIGLFVKAASVRNNTFLRPLQLQKDQTWSTACFVADLETVLQNYLSDLNFEPRTWHQFPQPSISACIVLRGGKTRVRWKIGRCKCKIGGYILGPCAKPGIVIHAQCLSPCNTTARDLLYSSPCCSPEPCIYSELFTGPCRLLR